MPEGFDQWPEIDQKYYQVLKWDGLLHKIMLGML